MCMCTSNGKIQIPVAHAHFERENKTDRCAAHFEKKLHSAPVRGHLKSYILCTVTKSIECNTCGRALPTRVKFATRTVISSSARLGYASATLSAHLDSAITSAVNFKHSSGIAFIPHLLQNILFLYTRMQNPSLRTVHRQQKWPVVVPCEERCIKYFFFTHACKTLVCALFTGNENDLFPHQYAK